MPAVGANDLAAERSQFYELLHVRDNSISLKIAAASAKEANTGLVHGVLLSPSVLSDYSNSSMLARLSAATLLKKTSGLLLLPLLMGCEDATENLFPQPQPVRLPAETRAGANTFGCLVNGMTWEASNSTTLVGKVLTPNAYYKRGVLRIDAFRRLQVDGPVTNIRFVAPRVTAPGVYELRQGGSATLQTLNRQMTYQADTLSVGTLTVTRLDTVGPHPVVSGRFELRAVLRPAARTDSGLPAQLRVTEGRFDIGLNRR